TPSTLARNSGSRLKIISLETSVRKLVAVTTHTLRGRPRMELELSACIELLSDGDAVNIKDDAHNNTNDYIRADVRIPARRSRKVKQANVHNRRSANGDHQHVSRQRMKQHRIDITFEHQQCRRERQRQIKPPKRSQHAR